MSRSSSQRRQSSPAIHQVSLAVLVAVAFGVAVSVVKGNGGGVRATIGNTSAPWLLLPFVAGAVAGRARPTLSAAVGTLVSFMALGGFYLTNTWVLDLGPHPWVVDLRLTFNAGREFFLLAVVSGPLFGALGGLWQQRRSVGLAVLVSTLLVLEPLAWLAYESIRPAAHYSNHPIVWAVEMVFGLGACTLAARVTQLMGPADQTYRS